jgi:putative oxidoreductase
MRTIEIHEYESDRKAATLALTLLRVAVGAILVAHGWQKLADIPGHVASFGRMGIPAPELSVYGAILGELFGGLGLAFGALTPLAAFGPVLVMAGAIFFVHKDKGLFAQQGGWEYPLTLLFVALYFALHGAGPLSVDGLVQRMRRRSIRHRQHAHAISRP